MNAIRSKSTFSLPAEYQRRIVAEAATAGDLDEFFRTHRRTMTGMSMVGPPGLPPANPPADPPADPPANPPADPPANPPADPPADPPANPPTNPPADPPRDDKVDTAKSTELGYPANAAGQSVRPVAEMKVEEQAAYWKEQARRHETAWKGKVGADLTPEQVAKMQADLKAIEDGKKTDAQKAVEEAETRGRASARAEANKEVYDAFVSARLTAVGKKAEEVPGLALIDVNKLLDTEGKIDTGKVALALDLAAPLTEAQQQTPWPFTGQGQRGSAQASGKDAGQAEADRRFPKKTAGQ